MDSLEESPSLPYMIVLESILPMRAWNRRGQFIQEQINFPFLGFYSGVESAPLKISLSSDWPGFYVFFVKVIKLDQEIKYYTNLLGMLGQT